MIASGEKNTCELGESNESKYESDPLKQTRLNGDTFRDNRFGRLRFEKGTRFHLGSKSNQKESKAIFGDGFSTPSQHQDDSFPELPGRKSHRFR